MHDLTTQLPAQRAVVDNVLTAVECKELLHIARACSGIGYRPNCCAITSAVLARVYPPYLLPYINAREKVRDAVEKALGLDLTLFVEFTGLISWRPGSAIGWHTDDNREYLAQRHAAAVVYLNSAETDFQGGTFKFKGNSEAGSFIESQSPLVAGASSQISTAHAYGQQPRSIEDQIIFAAPGRAVMYTTSETHCVDPPVGAGERYTLAMWFTTDPQFDEDRKILETIQQLGNRNDNLRALTVPAAMHALPKDGTDIRLCRLATCGIGILRHDEAGKLKIVRRLEEGQWGSERMTLRLVINEETAFFWLKKARIHMPGTLTSRGRVHVGSRMTVSLVSEAVRALHWALENLSRDSGELNMADLLLKSPGSTEPFSKYESVCARHLNSPSKREEPEGDTCGSRTEFCASSCTWLEDLEKVELQEEFLVEQGNPPGGFYCSAARWFHAWLQGDTEYYKRWIQPLYEQAWKAALKKWLEVGAIFKYEHDAQHRDASRKS